MQKTPKSACQSCGFVKPKQPKDLEKEIYCNLCDVSFKTADAKEHKKNNIHIIKNDLIKHIRELDATDEEDKKTINRLSKSLNVKYVKDKQNINQLE